MNFKHIAVLAALAGGAALAGDYLSFTQLQNGNGTNGTTQAAPTLATDGIAIASTQSWTGTPLATQCQVALRAAGTHTFNDPSPGVTMWVRGWSYSPDPNGSGNLVWEHEPAYDLNVTQALDAGTGTISIATNTLRFEPVLLKAATTPTTPDALKRRVDWTVENVSQTTAQDGGVGVSIECYTQ